MVARLRSVSLEDKYILDNGQLFLTGTQALVRLPLMQKRLDVAKGLHTAGFISGYRGSPLGGLDLALWKASKYLKAHDITFQPGINEDLGATAVWGSQQVGLSPGAQVQGVFGLWYGKGPGVDRTGDVLKHANFAGTSALGGVLALAGDDHACKSSTLPHQSEYAFIDACIPVFHPATVQDILDLGLYGWALSRFSGLWVGFKLLSDTVDTAASVSVDPDRHKIILPDEFIIPPGGLNLRWPDSPIDQEQRMHTYKLKAVTAFTKANQLNKTVWPSPKARLGVIGVGKGYLELRQALEDLGIKEEQAQQLGIKLFKVVVSWPLESSSILDFCEGLEEVIVVEEKRPVIESQLRQLLYHLPSSHRPQIVGKETVDGQALLPSTYELTSRQIASVLARCWQSKPGFDAYQPLFSEILTPSAEKGGSVAKLARIPYYCSGCPHNTSTTQLPQGSRALAGIGCHYMATWIHPATQTFAQMGGEGVPWIGIAPFTAEKHIFANLGDGTYYHSGILAIRASVAAKVNITYKILYNDAVAMTGGQPVEGTLTVGDITHQVKAEGVKRIAVVSDNPDQYTATFLAKGATLHHRDALAQVQEELKQWPGTSVLIYDQTCAAEKRRRRKRKLIDDPNRRLFINEEVCEGCGDCGQKSNCLSIIPLETEWGRKRQIDQSSCNKDYSCVKGFCPSFVSVIGGTIRPAPSAAIPYDLFEKLPVPCPVSLDNPYNIFITGIGGTGVVTIGALIAMAAHLEGKGCSVVDMAGLAQKGGAVVSHLRISAHPDQIYATRISDGRADLILGFDLVVTASPDSLAKIHPSHTQLLINSHPSVTGHFTQNPDYIFPATALQTDLLQKSGNRVEFLEAAQLATALMSDTLMTNLFMLGYALQKGWIPVSVEALEQAIHLNGVAVDQNQLALKWGRLAAVSLKTVQDCATRVKPVDPAHIKSESLDQLIQRRQDFLTEYQNRAYSQRYKNLVQRVRDKELSLHSEKLTHAVAQSFYRLMAYKDEYEVARLYTEEAFQRRLHATFSGDFKLQFHLAPPLLARRHPDTGELQKQTFGPWILSVFKFLAKLKKLRGTPFDIFGYTHERKMERGLRDSFELVVDRLLSSLRPDNLSLAIEIVECFQKIRGFGHVKLKNYHDMQKKIDQLMTKYQDN